MLEPMAFSVAWPVDACGMFCSWCSTGLVFMLLAEQPKVHQGRQKHAPKILMFNTGRYGVTHNNFEN